MLIIISNQEIWMFVKQTIGYLVFCIEDGKHSIFGDLI